MRPWCQAPAPKVKWNKIGIFELYFQALKARRRDIKRDLQEGSSESIVPISSAASSLQKAVPQEVKGTILSHSTEWAFETNSFQTQNPPVSALEHWVLLLALASQLPIGITGIDYQSQHWQFFKGLSTQLCIA